MFYYQFNIGDYAKHTRHLTNNEDLAYRRMLDMYYLNEEPIVNNIKKLARLIDMRGCEEDIQNVLDDFFQLSEGAWVNTRVERELEAYAAKGEKARANGKKGGRPRGKKLVEDNMQDEKVIKAVKTEVKKPEVVVESIDYLAVAEIFNRCLPRLSDLSKMTDARKKKVKKFFDEFDLTLERFENYLTHINDKKDLDWMFEKRPMNDGTGRNWQKQKFEYFIGEKCYLSVKENSDE